MMKHVHVQKILMRGLSKDHMYCTVSSLFCIKLTTQTNEFNYCEFVWISLFSTISGCPLDRGNAVSVFVSVSWILQNLRLARQAKRNRVPELYSFTFS